MSATCASCGDRLSNHKNRLCPHCAKGAKAEAYASGKIRPWNIKVFNDARGRNCRSSQVIGGAPKTGNEE